MSKRIVLVGHCGPDSTYLRRSVKSAGGDVVIQSADDDQELMAAMQSGADLLLFNRELGYGFETPMGADAIKRLKASYPGVRMMLVSNYPDAQEAAVQAGAVPGFGKRELGSPRVAQVLKDALR